MDPEVTIRRDRGGIGGAPDWRAAPVTLDETTAPTTSVYQTLRFARQ
jgi:hypothetical protein